MITIRPTAVAEIDGRNVTHFEVDTDRHGVNVVLAIEGVEIEGMAELALNLMHQGERISIVFRNAVGFRRRYTFGVQQFYIPEFGADVWILADNMKEEPLG